MAGCVIRARMLCDVLVALALPSTVPRQNVISIVDHPFATIHTLSYSNKNSKGSFQAKFLLFAFIQGAWEHSLHHNFIIL